MNRGTDIEAVKDQLIFEFLEDTTQGKFNEKTSGGVLVVEQADKQLHHCRWGRVLDTGPKVSNSINVGDIILIENLRWTNKFVINDNEYWMTTEDSIVALWDDKENLPGEVA